LARVIKYPRDLLAAEQIHRVHIMSQARLIRKNNVVLFEIKTKKKLQINNNDRSGTRHNETRRRQTFDHQTRRSTAHLIRRSELSARRRAEGKTKTERRIENQFADAAPPPAVVVPTRIAKQLMLYNIKLFLCTGIFTRSNIYILYHLYLLIRVL